MAGCPQAFAELILKQSEVKVSSLLSTELKGYDLEADGLLLLAPPTSDEFVLLIEFQSGNDKEMGDRLLDYSSRAKKVYDKSVLACVIFLRQDGIVPEPPLVWELSDGRQILVFDYICIKLWELSAEELLAFNQPALLPLTLLTKGGANRTMVERVFEGLVEHKLQNLLPAANLLAGLALGGSNLEWLKRRYKQMSDILKESPAYQWMTDDARAEGLEQGLEKGRREEHEKVLKLFRDTVVELVAARVPESRRLADFVVGSIADVGRLQHVIVELSLVPQNEDAINQYLWTLDKEQQKQNT